MKTERRQRRSEQPTVALAYFLESLARRESFEAVALADDDGLLLGGTGRTVDPEAMAAVAPVAARNVEHKPDGLLGLVTRGRPLRVWGVSLDGQSFHLVTIGEGRDLPQDTYTALGRILGSSCAPAC